MVRMEWDCRFSTGLPPSSRLRRLWSRKGDPAASVKPGQESCVRSSGIITLPARGPSDSSGQGHIRRGHNDDQSCRGHQCSETSLTGESRFHISTPQGIWTQVPCDGKQRVSPLDQWDMVRMEWDCRLSTVLKYDSRLTLSNKGADSQNF
jgi:hypothetical protein